MNDRKRAYFAFELNEDIDCDSSVLAVSVHQQGDRLSRYRDPERSFRSSSFNIVLLKDSVLVKAFTFAENRF